MNNEILQLASAQDLNRLKWEYEKQRTSYDDLLGLGTADMDYRSPEPILCALREVLERGHLGYPDVSDAFYQSIHDWLKRNTDWDIDAKTSILQNLGIYLSSWNVLDALTSPGDKITILTPGHFCFRWMSNLNNRKPLECPLLLKDNVYTINYPALEACFASGSTILWMANPHNPIGKAWSREELEQLAEVCRKFNVTVLSDDVYCGLTFPGTPYVPFASLSRDASQRTITLYSTSKSYNTTGIRHSILVSENPEYIKRIDESMRKMCIDYGKSIMGMAATIAAYNDCDPWLEALGMQMEKNHQFLANYFREHCDGPVITDANATYFAWADLRCLRIPPKQLAYRIEQEEHMVVSNGQELGPGGAGFVRINLAASEDNLLEAARRFERFCNRYGH